VEYFANNIEQIARFGLCLATYVVMPFQKNENKAEKIKEIKEKSRNQHRAQ
jgi:hypothetical protein